MAKVALGFLGGVVGFVGVAIKSAFWITVTTGTVGGAVLYATKPDKKSFDQHLKSQVKKNAPPLVSLIAGPVVSLVTTTSVKDYVFVQIGEVTIAGTGDRNTKYYLGAVQNWFELN